MKLDSKLVIIGIVAILAIIIINIVNRKPDTDYLNPAYDRITALEGQLEAQQETIEHLYSRLNLQYVQERLNTIEDVILRLDDK